MAYERQPFFLRGSQENITQWLAQLGLPADTPRKNVMQKMGWDSHAKGGGGGISDLFINAGIERDMDVANNVQYADTMDSQRLSWYARTVSPKQGERMWAALSRRYFEGKGTQIRPIRLDSRPLLLECAAEAGLDLAEAEKVLDSDVYRKEIEEIVERMHAAGINSIPVLCFEVDGVAEGDWLQNPKSRGRFIHHGSGNKDEFRHIFKQLHSGCQANM